MVVICEFVAADGGDRLELMVRKVIAKVPSGRRQGVEKNVVWIIHLVYLECGFQASFVEAGVVRHKRQALDPGRYLLPYVGEHWCIVSVLRPQSVHLPAEPLVVLRLGMDEAVEGVHNLPSTYDHHAHAAYAAGLLVGRLEVLCWGDSYVGLIWK